MKAWGIPAMNTLLLLTSGATLTWAHWGLIKNKRSQLAWGLAMTVILGVTFMGFQAYEYAHAYSELGLTPGAGVYGATFFSPDRFPRHARDAGNHHADRHVGAQPEGTLLRAQPLCL